MKSLFASKTFWYNALSALSLIFLLPEWQTLLGPDTIKYVLLANAVINIILRYVTDEPVKALSKTFTT